MLKEFWRPGWKWCHPFELMGGDLVVYERPTRVAVQYALGYDRGARQFPDWITVGGIAHIKFFLRCAARGARVARRAEMHGAQWWKRIFHLPPLEGGELGDQFQYWFVLGLRTLPHTPKNQEKEERYPNCRLLWNQETPSWYYA